VIKAEQLRLPGAAIVPGRDGEPAPRVEAVVAQLERLAAQRERTADELAPARPVHLSFSHLHQFEVCPVRYRFQEVWRVPAPPDELLPRAAGRGGSELGAAVHRALDAWHTTGGDLLDKYEGPEAGRELLRRYLEQPLASARTLGAEVEFNLRLAGDVRVKGLVDRVCELDGRTVLVDYKTNARLDERLRETYSAQLRLYGLAARRGLLPGGPEPDLVLFDLRRGEAIGVTPDPDGAEARVVEAAAKIAAGDFTLGPEHRNRPCFLCNFKSLCRDRR